MALINCYHTHGVIESDDNLSEPNVELALWRSGGGEPLL
jgi:hypothetical protein